MSKNSKNAGATVTLSKTQQKALEALKNDANKKNAAPVETKKVKTTSTKQVNVFLARGAGADALQGRVGARTHAIHVVLLDAARLGALLTTKEITARATAFMQAESDNEDAACNAANSHLNTMREKRDFVQREGGAWRLTDKALELCGASWAQDAPKKTKKVMKTKK